MRRVLRVQDLTVRYGDFTALDGLSFALRPGDWLMLVGPNGAGKSTAVKAIAQGVPYAGRVLMDGADVHAMPAALPAKKIGVLSQYNRVEYAYTVEEIVRLGRYAHERGIFSRRDADGPARIEDALRATGLTDLRGASMLTLSGGEAQRVFLAQVFAQDPALLLLDEPANHLDLKYQQHIFGLIASWLRQGGRAAVSVVHDLGLARRFGTQALLLHHGRCVAQGAMDAVFTPERLREVYEMDVYAWMRGLGELWKG